MSEAYNSSVCLTNVMGEINKILENEVKEPSPLPKCFKELEKVLSHICDFNMNLAARYVSLLDATDKSKATLEKKLCAALCPCYILREEPLCRPCADFF